MTDEGSPDPIEPEFGSPVERAFERDWSDLLPIGRDARSGGYRRYAWSSADLALREWFVGRAEALGLDVTVDRNHNLTAWWGDPDAVPGVVTGSHLDSVPDGGAYDGPLGVVSAFAAVEKLRNESHVPDRPIGIATFADEEGARFGVACTGSQLTTGALDSTRARTLRDDGGMTLAEAMRAAGKNPALLGRDDVALRHIATFVELHVEQGRGLIDSDRPVGVGTSIHPHGRWRFDFDGRADHAGTTRIADRDDPMLRLAVLVSAARTAADKRGILATVGKVLVSPNAVNAIPSHVSGWLDARGGDARALRDLVTEVSRQVGIDPTEESWTGLTTFDGALAVRLSRLLDDAPLLATGAGHDAGILATAGIPTAMLFIRNLTGVSHSPAEYAERADCLAGVAALARVLRALTSSPTGESNSSSIGTGDPSPSLEAPPPAVGANE